MSNLTENVVVAQLNVYGDLIPVTLEVRGTWTTFKATWQGATVEASGLADLEAKLKAKRREKRLPWNIPVKVVAAGKLVDALITGKHAVNRKFLVRLNRNRYGENVPTRVQMDNYAGFYKADAPADEYEALRKAVRDAEVAMSAYNKLWRVDTSTLAAPKLAEQEAAIADNAPLPEGEDEPDPLTEEESKAALAAAGVDEDDDIADR